MKGKRLSINLVANLLSYAIATILSFYITPFLVNHLGKEIFGFYGIANNFVSYITVVAVALNSMASKYITVELVRGNTLKAKQYFTSIFFSNVVLCLFLIPFLILIVFHLQNILSISKEHQNAIKILFALVFLAMIIRFITSIFGCSTYATDRMDLKAYIEIFKSLLRLFLYLLVFFVFKPSIIYIGLVLLLLEIFNSVVQIVISKRLLPQMKIDKAFFNIKLVVSTLKIGVWNSLNQLGDLLLSSSDLLMTNILLGELASGNRLCVKISIMMLVYGVLLIKFGMNTYEKNIVCSVLKKIKAVGGK